MKVLVTGGAGFIGSHLVEMLLAANHAVTIVDNCSTGSADNVAPEAHLIVRDIRESLDGVFADSRPEVVVHLAAQVSVPRSVSAPTEDASVNITGYVNLVQTAARFGVRKVIMVSSAAVYGQPVSLPLTEDAPLAPVSPYGLSKLVGEHYTRLLCTQYGLSYTILRPANVYGPRQTSGGEGSVIPSFLERFTNGFDPVIHGDGRQTRDFVFVEDMAQAIIAALTLGDGCTLNVGTGNAVSILDVWKTLASLVGWKRAPQFGPARAADIEHSVMDSRAAFRILGWRPTVDLPEGLARTVEWWQNGRRAAPAQANDSSDR
ncbi:NAD-dependent epimerase/dehydratase family protein [Symbiobacterium thermophilum]|uniref:NAD-dependent epimerase/dehydratase family protein n=1 Tax=Symbiobacterium thermophilum TaxID=2734 RepID=UPI002357BD5A|nr:NAD-dependent epimerase/dehydratase family protein [Symbiobacterium thermophilum]